MADNLYVLTIHRINGGFDSDRYIWSITSGEPVLSYVDGDCAPHFNNEVKNGRTTFKRYARKEMSNALKELLTKKENKVKLVWRMEVEG